ncbi:MAG: anti-sigma factor [Gemmataceae bacterium]
MSEPLNEKDREELVAYLDGELDEKTARDVEARLSLDPAARREVESLKKTWEFLDYLPRPQPSPDFTQRTLQKMAPQPTMMVRKGRPWLGRIGWAAAVLLAGFLGFAGTRHYLQQGHVPKSEDRLVRDLHVVDQLRNHEHVDDIDFLHKLANPNDPDLFGEDNSGS